MRLVVPDAPSLKVRKRVAAEVGASTPQGERRAPEWIEAVSEFDEI